jgi:hypothetical protein
MAMKVHWLKDGSIVCGTQDPLIRSSTNKDKVTCPECTPVLTPEPFGAEQARLLHEHLTKDDFVENDVCDRCEGTEVDPVYIRDNYLTGEPEPAPCIDCSWDSRDDEYYQP